MSAGVSAAPAQAANPTEADLAAIRVSFLQSAFNTTVSPSQVQDLSTDAISALSAKLAVKGQAKAPPATFIAPPKNGFSRLTDNPQGAGPVSALARADVLRYQSYAASAYCLKWIFNWKWNCNERCTNGLTDGTVIQDYFNKDSSTGFVAYNDNFKQIIISFRGSLFPLNFYRDLQLLTTPLTIGSSSAPPNTRVHYGFQESYKVAQPRVRAAVDAIRSNAARKGYTIVTTGHSLGGAVSVLAALDMKQRYPDAKVEGFTYGEPRVGNDVFAHWVDSLDMPITRVTASHDPIPTVPRREWGLGYLHHDSETYVTENHDNIVSCSEPANGDEPTDCLNGEAGLAGRDAASVLTPIWIAWHLHYSGMIFGPWC
ncbi:hypothetical protein HDU88_007581 [Geranomyces variabilis]|nr:hypothetical protein HDU88_007581 [Geranomyces variabilis]